MPRANRTGILGGEVNGRNLRDRILPVLIAGTRRETLPGLPGLVPGDARSALHALSLAGQALRFEQPATQIDFTVERWPHDERRIIPNDLRGRAIRLLASRSCAEGSELALAFAFDGHRLRPHPFDFPTVGGFVRKYAEQLGVTAQHWAQRDTAVEKRNEYFDADDVSEKNWTEAPRARRVKFLEELRMRDTAAARELLTSVWAHEDPETRVRLLATMQVGLAAEDKLFLQGIEKDRAPRVRNLVQRLLSRLPGETSENPALAAVLSRLQQTHAGKLRKRQVLKLELPANVKEQTASRWVHDEFQDVSLDELASALKLSSHELVRQAEDDSNLLFALGLMASREKQFDLLTSLAVLVPDLWSRMSSVDFEEPLFSNTTERDRWAVSLLHPESWDSEAATPGWVWLLQRMEGPLPASVMKELLHSKWWKRVLKDDPPPHPTMIQAIAALCPSPLRADLRELIESLDAERKDDGLLLMEILEKLESLA
jgi:hypothetical protein